MRHLVILLLHDGEEAEHDGDHEKLNRQHDELPAAARLMHPAESCRHGYLIIDIARHKATDKDDEEADEDENPRATTKQHRADGCRDILLYRPLADEYQRKGKQDADEHVDERLVDGNAVDGAPPAAEAFAHGHLAEAQHHIAHDDEQVVDHRGDQEDDGEQRHNPAHRLHLRIGGMVFGYLRERVVELQASFLCLGIFAVLLHHLAHIGFQVGNCRPFPQFDERGVAVSADPVIDDIVREDFQRRGQRYNDINVAQVGVKGEVVIDAPDDELIVVVAEVEGLAHHVAANAPGHGAAHHTVIRPAQSLLEVALNGLAGKDIKEAAVSRLDLVDGELPPVDSRLHIT